MRLSRLEPSTFSTEGFLLPSNATNAGHLAGFDYVTKPSLTLMTRRKSASEAIAERLLLVRYCSNHWQLWVESSRSPLTYFAHCGHPKVGAASRPIAGKPGSHRYCAGPETGYMSVGAGLPAMRPVLTTQRWGGVRHGSKEQPFTMGRFRPIAALQKGS